MAGALVTTVSSTSVGMTEATARLVEPESMKTTCPASISDRACCASARLRSGTCRERCDSGPAVGADSSAPPYMRWQSPAADNSRRSRRIMSSDTLISAANSPARTRPSFCRRSMIVRRRSSGSRLELMTFGIGFLMR